MKKLLLAAWILMAGTSAAQDTFSIVAIDSLTGEIGSAGASCINNSIIISDILPGRGAIHTQSYWVSTNQQNAHERMVEGYSPNEIIEWLINNDVSGNPSIRQYGIVDFDSLGHTRSAAFTGENCLDYKNHITGPNYSIQGNILLGAQILDSMEARFLNAEGSLAEKLMAALQGAKVPGADSRCLEEGVSAKSAFIRLAWPSDTLGTLYLDLNVPSRPYGVDPIDSLQVLFDEWLDLVTGTGDPDREMKNLYKAYPNPVRNELIIETTGRASVAGRAVITDLVGNRVLATDLSGYKQRIDTGKLSRGIYFLSITPANGRTQSFKLIKL